MKNYRLKKEAVEFFKSDLSKDIKPFEYWDGIGVDLVALEEVEPCYIDYGHDKGLNSRWLSGWSEDGSHFHFTVCFPSNKYSDHDRFTKGKLIRELMNRLQDSANRFYDGYNDLK